MCSFLNSSIKTVKHLINLLIHLQFGKFASVIKKFLFKKSLHSECLHVQLCVRVDMGFFTFSHIIWKVIYITVSTVTRHIKKKFFICEFSLSCFCLLGRKVNLLLLCGKMTQRSTKITSNFKKKSMVKILELKFINQPCSVLNERHIWSHLDKEGIYVSFVRLRAFWGGLVALRLSPAMSKVKVGWTGRCVQATTPGTHPAREGASCGPLILTGHRVTLP